MTNFNPDQTSPSSDTPIASDAAIPSESATPPRPPRGTGRRLHGAIAHKLGTAILSGEYLPGDTLSGEVAFSEALDVSRSAYREAVQVLMAKGLVESRPKTGTRVLPRSRWNLLDPDVLAWAFAGEPDIDFVRGLFELRAIVEPAAAALAAERRDRADMKTMKDALAAMTDRREALPRVAQQGVARTGEVVQELRGVGARQRPEA